MTINEIKIMAQWCNSNLRELSQLNFCGGGALFRFGSRLIETKSMRETAEIEDFISRLERDNFIVKNKLTRQGTWSYKLTLKAISTFSQHKI